MHYLLIILFTCVIYSPIIGFRGAAQGGATSAESQSMLIKIKQIAHVSTNNVDADFWIIRRGSAKRLGEPTKDFSEYHFGLSVFNTDTMDPDYFYFLMMYIHSSGYYEPLARGSISLQHIVKSDIESITFRPTE